MCNNVETKYMISAEPYVGRVATPDSVPSYYVTKLTEPIHNSDRNVTFDNCFSSISVAKRMKQEYSLTVVGALRKNKSEIPPSFTKCASASTLWFAYADGVILVSYCPKKKKLFY